MLWSPQQPREVAVFWHEERTANSFSDDSLAGSVEAIAEVRNQLQQLANMNFMARGQR